MTQVNEAEALRWPWNRKFQVDEMDACREAKDQGEGFEVQPFMLLRVLSSWAALDMKSNLGIPA